MSTNILYKKNETYVFYAFSGFLTCAKLFYCFGSSSDVGDEKFLNFSAKVIISYRNYGKKQQECDILVSVGFWCQAVMFARNETNSRESLKTKNGYFREFGLFSFFGFLFSDKKIQHSARIYGENWKNVHKMVNSRKLFKIVKKKRFYK